MLLLVVVVFVFCAAGVRHGRRGRGEELPANHQGCAREGSTGVVNDPDTPVGAANTRTAGKKGKSGDRHKKNRGQGQQTAIPTCVCGLIVLDTSKPSRVYTNRFADSVRGGAAVRTTDVRS